MSFPNVNGMSNVSSFNSGDRHIFSNSQNEVLNPDELLIQLLQQRHVKLYEVERLIKMGADVNMEDPEIPLHLVVSQPTNTHIITLLIQHGASTENILEIASANYDNDANFIELLHLGISPISNETVRNLFFYDFKPETIDLAIHHGAIIMETDSIGIYPFEYGTLTTFKYFQDKFNLSYNCSDKDRKPMSYYTITPLYNNRTLETNIQTITHPIQTHPIQTHPIQTHPIQTHPIHILKQLKEAHTDHIKYSTDRDRYILQQYTHVGDRLLHDFLIGKDNTGEIYARLVFKFNRNQYIEHRFIEMPYLYSMLDVGEITCIPQNYLLFFYEEQIRPLLLQQNQVRWFKEHTYRFLIDLYNVIQKAPKVLSPFVVYRGVNHNYLNPTKNTLFYLHTFSSTSILRETAERFGPIQYVMYIHPTCDYIYLEDVSVNGGEEEVLLNPYTRYIVMDWNTDKSVWYIGVLPPDRSIGKYSDLQKLRHTVGGGGGRKTRRKSRDSRPHSRLTDHFVPHFSRSATDNEIQMCAQLKKSLHGVPA
jgi:hypothetical protein